MSLTFDHLADYLPEAMALVSVNGRVRAANRSFAALVGCQRSAVVGRSLDELGWSGNFPEYLRRCSGTRSFLIGAATHADDGTAPRSFRCEGAVFEPRTPDSEPTVLLRFLLKDASAARFVSLSQKVSELSAEIVRRQRAEAETTRQRELLHVTLSSIGDAVITTDTSGCVTFMNDVAEQLTGWTHAAAAGVHVQRVFTIIEEHTRAPVEDPVSKVLMSGQVVGLANHTVLIARDGTERPIDDSGAPIKDAQGRIHGVVLVFRDVTELRNAERQEGKARLAAEAASRAKDEFFAILGHELRNPLAPIFTALQLMKLRGSDELIRERAIIERQVNHLSRLVDDLLDVSRIAQGKVELKQEIVDLGEVLARAIETTGPLIEQQRHTLDVRVPRQTFYLTGDATRLAQIACNLLNNAAKYTPAGGRIVLTARGEQHEVIFSVRDSGVGIAADALPYVFESFVQGRQPIDRAQGGLGLGLAIVKNLVERHGGTISAHSEGLGTGSEFVVRLPQTYVQGEPVPQLVNRSTTARVDRVRSVQRILIVDDNEDAAEMLAAALATWGFATRVANDGPSALAIAADFSPDIAFLDLGLPVMDGYELADLLRRLPTAVQPRLFALTGYGKDVDRQRTGEAGFEHHLVKPLDLHSIEHLLRGPAPRPP